MDSKVSSLFLIFILFISSTTPILGCPFCGLPSPKPKPKPKPKTPAPVTVPPVIVTPPIKPPVHPAPFPPVVTPVLPPTTPAAASCPIDVLKLGACVDILGGLAHLVLGKSAKSSCCPILSGLVDADAALCLCTTLKVKALDLNLVVPIALQVLLTCGKTPPPGYTCSL